jgi:hypothetical protein
MKPRDDRFYSLWILANAIAEGIGLGGTLLLAHFVLGNLEAARPGIASMLLSALLAVALGTVLEGALVGWAQGQVLAARLPGVTLGAWTLATSIGACIAWTLGMLPSTLAGLMEPAAATTPAVPSGPPTWVMTLVAAGMGLVLGPILALPQWRVLRPFAPRAWRWIAANAAAWGIGMVVIFSGMPHVPWHEDAASIAAAIVITCTLAGAAVGAVHGAVLQRMLVETETPAGSGRLPAPRRAAHG